jgi:hypothetical protein
MKRMIIFTDGVTLGAVLAVEPSRGSSGGGNGERPDFVEFEGSPFGGYSSLRELGDRIGEIVREEGVGSWHLIAPYEVKRQLADVLDGSVLSRLRQIGFGEMMSVAARMSTGSKDLFRQTGAVMGDEEQELRGEETWGQPQGAV